MSGLELALLRDVDDITFVHQRLFCFGVLSSWLRLLLLAGKEAAVGLLPWLVLAVEHAAVETLAQRVQLHDDISGARK
jgi:hypothetical protein